MGTLKSKLRALPQEPQSIKSSLRETLNRLYSRESSIKHFSDDSFTRDRRGMHEFVEGEYVNTVFGDIFVGKVRYVKTHQHGNVSLASITDISDDWLSRWGKFPSPRKFNHRKTVFVDTETSGLAGGGGTLAFLIGIGYYYRNEFRVEQFFADSHSREEGMLDLVADFLKPFDTLVTFNGKTFDIPLLETRYLLKRKQNPFARMAHLDILHPSRQLWNLSLENCKLQTIERHILGFTRENDLPGEDIPQAYFNYIRWGEPDPLFRVFEHNAHDIATLAAVTYVLWYKTRNEEKSSDSVVEFSKGKVYHRHGENDRAIQSLESAKEMESSTQRKMRVTAYLSMLYKSMGEWDKALECWQSMIDEAYPFYLLPYVEMAKFYEHKTKEIKKAKELVESAVSKIAHYRIRELEELVYRLDRLNRKLKMMEGQ